MGQIVSAVPWRISSGAVNATARSLASIPDSTSWFPVRATIAAPNAYGESSVALLYSAYATVNRVSDRTRTHRERKHESNCESCTVLRIISFFFPQVLSVQVLVHLLVICGLVFNTRGIQTQIAFRQLTSHVSSEDLAAGDGSRGATVAITLASPRKTAQYLAKTKHSSPVSWNV